MFSLARSRARSPKRASQFRSHLDGALHLLTPETATDIQAQLGSDIAMVLDECIATPARRPRTAARDRRWSGIGRAGRGRGRGALGALQRARRSERRRRTCSSPTPARRSSASSRAGPTPALRTESVQATVDDRLRGLRDRRAERRGAGRRHVRGRRPHRAAAARRPAALPDGDRHARRPGRVRRARHRHVRLRAADPERPERPAAHRARASSSSRTPATRRTAAARSGLRLLHLPALFSGPTCATCSWPGR